LTGVLNGSWEVYVKTKTEGKEACLSRSPWRRGLEDARHSPAHKLTFGVTGVLTKPTFLLDN